MRYGVPWAYRRMQDIRTRTASPTMDESEHLVRFVVGFNTEITDALCRCPLGGPR